MNACFPQLLAIICLTGACPAQTVLAQKSDKPPGVTPSSVSDESESMEAGPTLQPKPSVWLGLNVSKLGRTTRAQVHGLPDEVGFLVRTVEGPAQEAGLREYDIVWKLDEQILINESQLAALLRMRKPGEEVTLSGFRSGQAMTWKAVLAVLPPGRSVPLDEMLEDSIFRGACGGPVRMLNLAEKTATYSNDQGTAEVRKVGEDFQLTLRNPEGEVTHQSKIPADGRIQDVPEEWRRGAQALRRGLQHAMAGNLGSVRQPRPRVVVPPPPVSESR